MTGVSEFCSRLAASAGWAERSSGLALAPPVSTPANPVAGTWEPGEDATWPFAIATHSGPDALWGSGNI